LEILRFFDDNLEKYLCVLLLVFMTVVTALQVVFRLLGLPLAWSEEAARYMFVWLIYISCSYAVKEEKHIKIDAVLLLFKERGRFFLALLSNLLFLVFTVVISYQGALLVHKIAVAQRQVSPALRLSMGIPYSSFVVGCALMSLRLIQSTVRLLRSRWAPPAETKETGGV
jgi:TRAP-type C4-dicarboxylate transport system permease small subunit